LVDVGDQTGDVENIFLELIGAVAPRGLPGAPLSLGLFLTSPLSASNHSWLPREGPDAVIEDSDRESILRSLSRGGGVRGTALVLLWRREDHELLLPIPASIPAPASKLAPVSRSWLAPRSNDVPRVEFSDIC